MEVPLRQEGPPPCDVPTEEDNGTVKDDGKEYRGLETLSREQWHPPAETKHGDFQRDELAIAVLAPPAFLKIPTACDSKLSGRSRAGAGNA